MEHPRTDILLAFVDDTLDPAQGKSVEAHIKHCAQCRDVVAFERRVVHAIRDVPLSRPSPQFDNAVLAAARKLPVEEATGKLRPRHYISAALLIAATLVVVVLAGSSGETQSQSMLSPVFEKITDVLSPLTEQFRTQSERIFPDVTARQSPVLKVFLLASIALLFIGSLDRFILPKMRHRGHPGQ